MKRKSVFEYCAKHGPFDGDVCKGCAEDSEKDNAHDAVVRLRAEVERLNKVIEVMNAEVVDAGKRERSLRAKVERLKAVCQKHSDELVRVYTELDSAARANGTLGKLLTEVEKKASGQPDLVDSERAANAILTDEVERLTRERDDASLGFAAARDALGDTLAQRDENLDHAAKLLRELKELRRKCGEWADQVDALGDCMADGIVSSLREESGK